MVQDKRYALLMNDELSKQGMLISWLSDFEVTSQKRKRVLGRYSLLSFVLSVYILYRSQDLNPNSTSFYSSFYCCILSPLSQVEGLSPSMCLYVPVPSQEPVAQWLLLLLFFFLFFFFVFVSLFVVFFLLIRSIFVFYE